MIYTFLCSLILSLAFVTSVYAQQGILVRREEGINREIQQDKIFREEEQDATEEREEAKGRMMDVQSEMREKQEIFRNMIQEKRIIFKKEIEKERVKLKTQLKSIRDTKKKEVVERIGTTLNDINERQVTHATAVLEKIEIILTRIRERMTTAEKNGVDVSAVKTSFVIAEGAITAVKTAIETQSKKMYTVNVSTEAKLRDDAGGARTILHTDLSGMRDMIRAAHVAVQNVATALSKIPRTMQINTPTIKNTTSGMVEPTSTNTSVQ